MYSATLSRADLNAVFSGQAYSGRVHRTDFPRDQRARAIAGDEFAVFWRDDPGTTPDIPQLVVTPNNASRELTAWLLTYAAHVRPFSAYCRVIDQEDMGMIAGWRAQPRLPWVGAPHVGLILGELLSEDEMPSRARSRSLSVSAALSTLSFALGRGNALYGTDCDGLRVSRAWAHARRMMTQRERRVNPNDVLEIAEVLVAAEAGHSDVGGKVWAATEAFSELTRRGELGPHSPASRIIEGVAPGAHAKMQGPQEERVSAFEAAIQAIARSSNAEAIELAPFLCGYLASRIAPGTLDHAPLLSPYLSTIPAVMLWYGVCAGVNGGANVLEELGGLGRRIRRELLSDETLVAPPKADIGTLELEILVATEDRDEGLIRASSTQLLVELMPGIVSHLVWPTRERTARAAAEMDLPSYERTLLARELRAVTSRLNEISTKISGRAEPEFSQQSLFKKEKSTRRQR